MFWECRWLWPHDPWFTEERFGEAPVTYVYQAIAAGRKARREDLHEEELAVANLAALTANLNRDPKKVKKPYTPTDFCFFAPKEALNRPDDAPAAAYMQMAQDGTLPRWALFIWQDMKGGVPAAAPMPLAAIGEGFLLLAPVQKNGGLEGLMVATSEASGQHVEVSLAEETFTVAVPTFEGHAVAREHVYVPIM